MKIYRPTKLDNKDILLERIIIDDKKYIAIPQDDGNILLKRKIDKVDEKQYDIVYKKNGDILLKKKDINYDYTGSAVHKCVLNGVEYENTSYAAIIRQIYRLIKNVKQIINNTKLNIKMGHITGKGYVYIEELDISIQRVEANISMKEIINQCNLNDIELELTIKLDNGEMVDI